MKNSENRLPLNEGSDYNSKKVGEEGGYEK